MADTTSSTEVASNAEAVPSARGESTPQSHIPTSSRALCPVCCRNMPVTKAGRVRVHGPLSNRCAGSRMSSTTLSTSSTVIDPGPTSSDTLSSSDPHLQPLYARILKRIPRASRHLAVTKLAGILNEITEKNEISSWSQLATFSTRFFSVQKRGGRRRSLASAVNAQLRDESLTQPHPSQRQPGLYKPRDPQSLLATQVSSKLEEGDCKGAVWLTCSEDTIAVINDEKLSAIRAKHPLRHPDTSLPLPIEDPPIISPLSEREILKAIRSFPCGSAGGPDGLRPQYLKDLTSASAERGGKELLWCPCFLYPACYGRKHPLSSSALFLSSLSDPSKEKGWRHKTNCRRTNPPPPCSQMC